MTDIPDTTTLKRLLAQATPGPWLYRTKDYDDWGVVRNYDGWMVARASVASVSDEDADAARRGGYDPVESNARLISLAPTLAARVIELEAEVANLRDAIHAATDPDFIWGAMDNVFDVDSDLDDLAAAASRAIRAALGDRT